MKCYMKIDKQELEKLYIEENLSQDELVVYYNISLTSIRRALSFYNIKKPREVINKKMKLAFIKKYGVENPSCCREVKEKKKKTFIKHYGTNHYFQTSEFKRKAKESKINKYGDPNFSNRELAKHTLNRKYGVDNVSQLQFVKDKKKNTYIKRYNVENISQLKEIKEKKRLTQHTNNTFVISSKEEKIYFLLQEKFKNVKRQYKSESYPFNCDFYLPEIDLYIEYQGHWSHGPRIAREPYDKTNPLHNEIVENWKLKNTDAYLKALKVWTVRDPLKREIAKRNNLNWVEFFSIEEFNRWFNNL